MGINWNLTLSLGGEKYHSLKFLGEYRGVKVEKEVHTPVKGNGFGEPTIAYFITDTGKQFESEEDLINEIDFHFKGGK